MKIIIPILVGSAIGYFTNWLAIKMLFRPLKEKRILGIKLPFTPGLIPKERKRISKSIGEAVGMHLLTPEKIREVISSDKTKVKIRELVELKIDGLRESEESFIDVLKTVDADNYNLYLEDINEKVFNLLLSRLKQKGLKTDLINFIEEDIYDKYKGMAIDGLLKVSNDLLKDAKQSPRLKELFIETIEKELNNLKDLDRPLIEVIPEGLIDRIDLSIENNKSNIMDSLRQLFYKPHIQRGIKLSLEDLVEQNVSKMITMFIDSATISEKVFLAISKYVDSNQAEEVAGFILKDSLDNIANMKLASITEYINSIIEKGDISNIYEKIIDYTFKEENKDKVLDIFIKNIRSKDEDIKNSIIELLGTAIDNTLDSQNFQMMIRQQISKGINLLINTPISNVLKSVDNKEIEKIMDVSDKAFNTMLKGEVYNIINLFNVSKIVEDQINGFEVEYTEELILNIADRELKAITRLGALLGAIMGLLTPLLQMI